ncbi:transporter substrate-binding domain-containing protein [Endozoicomonas sp. SM1973]|uniref:Transporter substrate-binding domain-containing protein n=1 Tax=Spartinivicinus marinus TaxID=2994442 RepID=A0A853IG90_9GAMM|nr:transporter substrate-binding domain-containing protein [Spartinivicinus marinus]MCX4027825.1 transporter substrate-binding domain-containing protein [Spartinivicinus marinus]NYZ69034.1 transporter substrate-binding domain-containing protein [Spartinivicinus marinus]
MKEAYHNIGGELEVRYYPGWKRTLIEANKGNTDGELFRIYGTNRDYPNLVMVPVPVAHIEGVAFTGKEELKSFVISGWHSIQYNTIGYIGGIRFIANGTKGFSGIEVLSNMEQLLQSVNSQHLDLGINDRITLLPFLKADEYSNIKILEPPLQKIKLYHYLHKRNSKLILQITKALKKMENENRIKVIRDEFLHKIAE